MKIKTRRYYLYYLARVGGFLLAILPLRVGLFLAGLAGRIVFAVLRKPRNITINNLKSAFPEKPDSEIRDIAGEVFVNLARNGIELLNAYKLNKSNCDRWMKAEGVEKLDKVLEKGKGAIMLASHFGNWELISFYFLLRGHKGTVIAKRIYFERYNKFINRVRQAKNLGIIYRDESPKKILRLLRKNELIGVLADQDVDSVDGVFVDFFGKKAYTPKGPVALSLASGAALVPCFIIRDGWTNRLVVEDPIEPVMKESKEETIRFNTQRWSDLIESYIRKYPGHWVWMHRRWKTRPVSG